MDPARDELLARSRLAGDEHGAVGRRDLIDGLDDRRERGRAEERIVAVVARGGLLPEVGALQLSPTEGGRDHPMLHLLDDQGGEIAEDLRFAGGEAPRPGVLDADGADVVSGAGP